MVATWFKNRLNYLNERFAGRTGWTDTKLDMVPIAYYRNGLTLDPGAVPMMLEAQVGRSQNEVLMGDGQIMQSKDRDYFIYAADLGFEPEEGDIILDDNWSKYYCKVSTRFSRSTYSATNETNVRWRVRTVVVHSGDFANLVPDQIATWLRTGVKPAGAGYIPERDFPESP